MQVGAGPPFQNPPLVGDVGGAFGASLRAWMQGRAIPGRRTQTPGRSPCFRTLPGLHFISSWCWQAWEGEVEDRILYLTGADVATACEDVDVVGAVRTCLSLHALSDVTLPAEAY